MSAYVGDGANRRPAVHRLDAACLSRLAMERGRAGALHGVAENNIPMLDIAGTIGDRLGLPVRRLTAAEAAAPSDGRTMFAEVDNATSSTFTPEAVGWQPLEAELLADMDARAPSGGLLSSWTVLPNEGRRLERMPVGCDTSMSAQLDRGCESGFGFGFAACVIPTLPVLAAVPRSDS